MKPRALVLVGIVSSMSLSAFVACSDDSAGPASSLDATAPDGSSPTTEGGSIDDASSSDARSDAGSDASADDLGPLGDFCAKYAKATCDRVLNCYPNAQESCVEEETSCRLYARAELLPAMNAGLITFDAAKAAECLATPPADFCEANNLWSLAPCRQVFAGTVPNGGSCFNVYFFETRSECKDGTCLPRPDAGGFHGTCDPGICSPFFAKGASCTDDAGTFLSPGCGPLARCGSSRTCEPNLDVGAACTSFGDPCSNAIPHVICAPQADGGAGYECTRARDAGAACGNDLANLSSACKSGVCVDKNCVASNEAGVPYCSNAVQCPTGTLCQSSTDRGPLCLPPIAAGEACDVSRTCAEGATCTQHDAGSTCDPLPGANQPCNGSCLKGLVCSAFDGGTTCLPAVPAGGTCRGAGDDTCVDGLRCDAVTRTCVPFIAYGAVCVADADCERGLYCDDASKRCRSWKPNGASCNRNQECVYASACSDAGVCNTLCVVP